MSRLVNIIHPYTFKIQNDALQIGKVPEYAERDQMLADFLETSLEADAHIIHHRDKHPKDPTGLLVDVAFVDDPVRPFLFDDRVDIAVTSPMACPVQNVKPPEIKQEMWDQYIKYFTLHDEMAELVGTPDIAFFIGGVMEACIANASAYHHEHFRTEGQKIFYIPELCVCLDPEARERTIPLLEERDIKPLPYDKALELLVKKAA